MNRDSVAIVLDPQQRAQIYAMMRGQKTEYRLKQRATIIWQLAEDHLLVSVVAAGLGVSVKTVRKGRERMGAHGVSGLEDAPRSGAPSPGSRPPSDARYWPSHATTRSITAIRVRP